MPLGDFVGEVILRPIIEFVFYVCAYWTGFVFLKMVSFGAFRLAPLMTIDERNPGKKKWYQIDWSIWLHLPEQGRALKAECICLV